MAGKFELYTDKSGEYRFRLKAGNGEVIAISEGYSSKSAALNGIDSVRRNAADAEVVEAGWVDPSDRAVSLRATPWAFSPWLVLQAEQMHVFDAARSPEAIR